MAEQENKALEEFKTAGVKLTEEIVERLMTNKLNGLVILLTGTSGEFEVKSVGLDNLRAIGALDVGRELLIRKASA